MVDPQVVVADDQAQVAVDVERWADLARAVLVAERAEGELSLSFVERDEITELNARYLGHDGPTDVLAFPLDTEPTLGDPRPEGTPILLGDVVVSPEVAAAQAPDHAGTLDDELALLVVHGVLHVLGYDHAEADDAAAMRHRERELLEAHHWRGPAPRGFRAEQV